MNRTSTYVVSGRGPRRTSHTQIVNQISAITYQLVKPVTNDDKEWRFIMKSQPKSYKRIRGQMGRERGDYQRHPRYNTVALVTDGFNLEEAREVTRLKCPESAWHYDTPIRSSDLGPPDFHLFSKN
ncbi:hypothetical protein EVAR_37595_1 [Eumeta japonica]|uniref:Uncharacterized protein n=1 Tax=Eumeta variegata TaxID=151549 RepID=A0A4C1VQT0_EUMVA|nr:hypothetical protein EVAR_37595_1 [Eumeta japonica]